MVLGQTCIKIVFFEFGFFSRFFINLITHPRVIDMTCAAEFSEKKG